MPRSERDSGQISHRRTDVIRWFDPPIAASSPCTMHHPTSALTHSENTHLSPFLPHTYILQPFSLAILTWTFCPSSQHSLPGARQHIRCLAPLCFNPCNSRCFLPTLKKESVRSFQTTVHLYQPTRRHALEEGIFQSALWQTQITQGRYTVA